MAAVSPFAKSFLSGCNFAVWVYDAAHYVLRNGGATAHIKLYRKFDQLPEPVKM